MAKKNAAAGPSKPAAAPAKPKAKPAPKAKAPSKKRAAAKDTTVDTVSPTSTESTVIPSPAKRRKTSAPLNSSQQTETSTTGKYSTPYVNGRPWYDFSDINRQLNVGTGDDIEHIKIVSAPPAATLAKRKKGAKLGKGSSSATMVGQMGEEEFDSDDPLSDPPEDEDVEDAYVAPETRSPTPGPSKPDFVPKILPLRMQEYDTKPPLLVKSQHNWFPGYLVNFFPVRTFEEEASGKKNMWQVEAHPATGWKGSKTVREKDIMYLDDERLAGCTIGHIHSEERRFPCDARTRAQSPEFPNGPNATLPPLEEFISLPRTSQIRHLRPHLHDIINERYAPAQSRLDLFYKTYHGNTTSLRQYVKYGDISSDEVVEVFIPELQRWMRGCKPDLGGQVEAEAIPSGSNRFNNLNDQHKRDFLQLVLIPEVIIRICIASTETETLLAFHPKNKGNAVLSAEEAEMMARLGGQEQELPQLDMAEEREAPDPAEGETAAEIQAPIVNDAEVAPPEDGEAGAGDLAGPETGVDVGIVTGLNVDAKAGESQSMSGAEAGAGTGLEAAGGVGGETQQSASAETESSPTAGAEKVVPGDIQAEPESAEAAVPNPETDKAADVFMGPDDQIGADTEPAAPRQVDAEPSEAEIPLVDSELAPPVPEVSPQTPARAMPTEEATIPLDPPATQIPAPTPIVAAPAPADTPSEDTIYNLAKLCLDSLAAESAIGHWELIINEINSRRSQARQAQGLPEEKMSEFEKEVERLKNPLYEKSFFGDVGGGRVRKRLNYAQLSKGVEQTAGSPSKRARGRASGGAGKA